MRKELNSDRSYDIFDKVLNFSPLPGIINDRSLRPFLEVRKNLKLLEHKHITYHFEARVIWIFQIHNLFREKFKFRSFTKAVLMH